MPRNLSIQEQQILLGRVSDGDIAAFRILFDTYNKRLYAAALKITKSPYGAEEIVQEVFAGLWESRTQLKEVENPPAYIFTVAYNRTFRYLKKVSKSKALKEALRHRVHEARNDTEEWMDVKETNALINRAIGQLPPRRRLIFKLSREEGLSHKEIAERLNISPLTVKKQVVIALRNIRASISATAPLLAILFFIH